MRIGVIGSRSLPEEFRSLVFRVVRYLVERGFQIHSGGALGADQFALEAVLALGAFDRAVIFSPWSLISGFPRSVQQSIHRLLVYGGRVDWGFVQPGSSRRIVVPGLLARNTRLVSASSGVVAFLYGESRGTLRTVRQAIERGLRVVVFLCGEGASLPRLSGGRWVCLGGRSPLSGSYLFLPDKSAQRQPTMEASGAVRMEVCHG